MFVSSATMPTVSLFSQKNINSVHGILMISLHPRRIKFWKGNTVIAMLYKKHSYHWLIITANSTWFYVIYLLVDNLMPVFTIHQKSISFFCGRKILIQTGNDCLHSTDVSLFEWNILLTSVIVKSNMQIVNRNRT